MPSMPTINIVLPIREKEFVSLVPKDYDGRPKEFINYISERLINIGKLQLDLEGQNDLENFLKGRRERVVVVIWSEDRKKLFTVTAQVKEPAKNTESVRGQKNPIIQFTRCPSKAGLRLGGGRRRKQGTRNQEYDYNKPCTCDNCGHQQRGFLSKLFGKLF